MSATTPVEPEATEDADTEGNRFHGIVEDAGNEDTDDDTDGNHAGSGHVAPVATEDDTEGNRFHGI